MSMSKEYSVKLEWTNTGYILLEEFAYFSHRYEKWIFAHLGEEFDGATGAIDICPPAWIAHDVLCRDGKFADGTPCSNWQASRVLTDILKEKGHWVRRYTWLWATFLFGGGKARDNGMIKVNKD